MIGHHPDKKSLQRFGSDARQSLQHGLSLVERVLGPTLGPGGRPVAIGRIGRPGKPPELLDDAATITRRITGIRDPFANMGVMLARNLALRVRNEVGGGGATAVVICASAYRALARYIEAGVDLNVLRRGVDSALQSAVESIEGIARPLDETSPERYVASLVRDADIVRSVSEAVTVLGPDGVIVVRDSVGDTTSVEFIEGAMWESGLVSQALATNGTQSDVLLADPRVLIWDAPLDDQRSLTEALDRFHREGVRSLMIVATRFDPSAVAVLLRANRSAFQLIAVEAPFDGPEQLWALQDMAVLTDARVLSPKRGDKLGQFGSDALGRARRVKAGTAYLNLIASDTSADAVVRQASSVRRMLRDCEDNHRHRSLLTRLGRLEGGMAIVWVGSRTLVGKDLRRQEAREAVRSLRSAYEGGVVPGGGASYLAAEQQLPETGTTGNDFGVLVVAEALEAPARWIAHNAGIDGGHALALGRNTAAEMGLDVMSGEVLDLVKAGIVDPAPRAVMALSAGVNTAVLAASCEVLGLRPSRSLTAVDFRP